MGTVNEYYKYMKEPPGDDCGIACTLDLRALRPPVEHMGVGNLRAALVAINATNALSNVPRPARGLLVVPASSNLPATLDDEIAVLKYDEQLNFTNAETVLNWIRVGEG